MSSINITNNCGMIVRRAALHERAVSMESLLIALEVQVPLDMNETLISFGPFFGGEALNEFTRRLTELGLVFFDDFFDVMFDSPPWCRYKAELIP